MEASFGEGGGPLRIRFQALAALLGLCLALAGCAFMYAPLGPTPGRLEIKASGEITQAMIKQAVE